MRTGNGCLLYMRNIADAGGDNFRLEAVIGQDGLQIRDQLHAVHTDIIQTSNERTDISSPGFGGHQALSCGEDKGYVGFDPFFGQFITSFQAIFSHWQLDDNIRCPFCDFVSFLQHFFGFQTDDLSADRARHNGNDLFDYIFEKSAFFGDKRRICRYAIH
ncbi:hypothetical protein D3C75_1003350 [compost metagenome]